MNALVNFRMHRNFVFSRRSPVMTLSVDYDDDDFHVTEGGMLWLESMVSQIENPTEIPPSLIFGDLFRI